MELSQKLLEELVRTRELNAWDWTTLATELGVSPQRLSNWVKRGGVSKDAIALVMRRFPEFFVPGGAGALSTTELLSLKLNSADPAQLLACSMILECPLDLDGLPGITMEELEAALILVDKSLALLRRKAGKRPPQLTEEQRRTMAPYQEALTAGKLVPGSMKLAERQLDRKAQSPSLKVNGKRLKQKR